MRSHRERDAIVCMRSLGRFIGRRVQKVREHGQTAALAAELNIIDGTRLGRRLQCCAVMRRDAMCRVRGSKCARDCRGGY